MQCANCSAEFVGTEHTTGYGVAAEGSALFQPGQKVCFRCCALDDVACMKRDGFIGLYLTDVNGAFGRVTNWPGTLTFNARVKRGKHNIGRTRFDVWFQGLDGATWHGVNIGDNQIVRCKRVKGFNKRRW